LAFDYCDVVAGFYRLVFFETDDISIRTAILQYLPIMGYDHNRYYVGRVFAGLLERAKDESLVMAVREAFLNNPEAASWCSEWLPGGLPKAIREAVPDEVVDDSSWDDDQPF
jgi:hypothetical protein